MTEIHNYRENKAINSVLITGGSGLIGKKLTSELISSGFSVSHLARRSDGNSKVKVHIWDPANGIISPDVFEGIDCLVHLAGANIGDKRWTARRKNEIIRSRVDSAKLLFRTVKENNIQLKTFITASAVGYYGSVTSDRIFIEEDPPAEDFMGTVCRFWEEAADLFEGIGIRTVKIRTGIVLDKSEGVLPKFIKPAKYGLVIRIGSGRQYFPWIHAADLCSIYLKAITDQKLKGAYNAVVPECIDYDGFVKTLARTLNRPVMLPPVPAMLIKAMLGEMSDIVLKGSCVSPKRIIEAGFTFRYKSLEDALKNIMSG